MQKRREVLAAGISVAGALSLAGCFNRVTGKDATEPEGGTSDSDEETPGDGTPEGKGTPEDGTPDEEEYDLPSDYINVREYGAVGDGLTDDSEAIQDAIEAAEPGETVFLPETEASYLLSFDKTTNDGDNAIRLSGDSGLDNVTVLGETAARGAQTLQVEAESYDESMKNKIFYIETDEVIDGFKLQNLTIDGARPDNDPPAGLGGETSITGIILQAGGANGGHDILFEDILIQNCSNTGLRVEESGVTCRRVTSRGHGRHGFNPVMSDTTVDPGFVGQSISAVDCDGTGIDHRRGTARLAHVYTENNRQGNKWKHFVERLEVENHHSVNDQNHGWRSNHSASSRENIPSEQEIIFNDVFIENPEKAGLRLKGWDTPIVCALNNVEVRNAKIRSSREGAGVLAFQDVEMLDPGSGKLVVVKTANGVGVDVFKAVLDIGTYLHSDNELGASSISGDGIFSFRDERRADPGRNVFQTPGRDEVGAFTEPIDGTL